MLVREFHQAGGWQAHHPVALTKGRLEGQTQAFWTLSLILLLGQVSHNWVVGLRNWGGVQTHLPSTVAEVPGGQQIFCGPVGAVPAGQLHWSRFESKM